MNSPPTKPYLSKSRLISAWQCSKKLHLQAHHQELAETNSMAESLFAAGNQAGEIAKQVFGSGDGVEIPYSTGLNEALEQTAELVANGHDATIYEATLNTIPPATKAELEEQLLRYCRFDTEAMVRIVRFLTSS